MYSAALPGPRSAMSAIARVSPSEQPSGSDNIAGGPPAPSDSPSARVMRLYCTPGGKSSAVSTTRCSFSPGQVGVPLTACAQPVSSNDSSTATVVAERRLVMSQGYRRDRVSCGTLAAGIPAVDGQTDPGDHRGVVAEQETYRRGDLVFGGPPAQWHLL